jgi:predicted ester cyclase
MSRPPLLLIAFALIAGCAPQVFINEELAEKNKALVRRFLDEVYNKGNLAVADEVIAEKYVSHNQLAIEVLGPEGIKNIAKMQRAAFPDQVSFIEDMIAEGDKVVVRGKDTGTHSGAPFMGIPAKGNKFTITWIDVFRVENGKLVEAWLEIDVERFRKQLLGEEEN